MATTYGAPGVYVEEVPSGSMPIQGVGTSTAAFVGFTQTYVPEEGDERDPEGVMPQLVTSWDQYERVYGGFDAGALLPYAVQGFFLNGGAQCFVVRVPRDDAAPEAVVGTAADPQVESFRVEAIEPVPNLQVVVERPGPAGEGQEPPQEFTLRVLRDGRQLEEFGGLTFGRGGRNAEKVVNETSTAVRVSVRQQAGAAGVERLPAAGTFALQRSPSATLQVRPEDFQGSATDRTGVRGLVVADSVSMVAAPDLITLATRADGTFDMDGYIGMQGELVDWCEKSTTMMAILDAPPGLNATAALDWTTQLARSSSYAAAYYPHLVIRNPLAPPGATNGVRHMAVPPSGHVAGVWARTDATRGVHKAPANEAVRGVVRLERDVTAGEQDLLNPRGINCIRSFGANGLRVWGARTLSLTDPSWRYVPVRRLFIYLEESIRRGTQWAVFEPNDRDLWERVKRTINAFLRGVWRSGALVGATPDQAFYVRCDESNNPASSVDEGKLVVDVGVAPVKPAEFVIFRITQWQGPTE
ncbi:phage tail sheath family protein [Actinotalea ferrariae]|uniref:phage tail sheath family protein n=1 Tax=Actinotalea ferrariae TaxID=1386098 RepID=UPI001C8B66C6|nr:phage tail sheath C-terminal domain-containing protein [Actinotalea ferrariae]MBX9243968.1 phage tail sheath family protein [Actinotalea ferrariae]